MKALFSIALGVIAAIGGFVDIGDLVFNAQAGSSVGTPALWATRSTANLCRSNPVGSTETELRRHVFPCSLMTAASRLRIDSS